LIELDNSNLYIQYLYIFDFKIVFLHIMIVIGYLISMYTYIFIDFIYKMHII